mmetsp:Transcript_2218/g.7451  ORF Transcript_2218/g.7451 Transcript_2218/m.7451 type:complete len:125 (+) Transcript_2218:1-375(+)
MGFWTGPQASGRGYADYMAMASRYLKPGGSLIWRTTNWLEGGIQLGNLPREVKITGDWVPFEVGVKDNRIASKVAIELGAHVTDVVHLQLSLAGKPGFKTDLTHWEPVVYEALNTILLHWACGR